MLSQQRNWIRITLIILGLLDLHALFRIHPGVLAQIEKLSYDAYFVEHVAQVMIFLFGVSLICSGLLTGLGKKAGLLIYYFQIPLRVFLPVLTFGFAFTMMNVEPAATSYYSVLSFVYALEIARLAMTIYLHKKYYSKIKTVAGTQV